jgi:hypothetical protein
VVKKLISEILLQQLTVIENGYIIAFAIGVPLAVWGYLSFLKQDKANPGKEKGRTVKRYTPDGKPVYD